LEEAERGLCVAAAVVAASWIAERNIGRRQCRFARSLRARA